MPLRECVTVGQCLQVRVVAVVSAGPCSAAVAALRKPLAGVGSAVRPLLSGVWEGGWPRIAAHPSPAQRPRGRRAVGTGIASAVLLPRPGDGPESRLTRGGRGLLLLLLALPASRHGTHGSSSTEKATYTPVNRRVA